MTRGRPIRTEINGRPRAEAIEAMRDLYLGGHSSRLIGEQFGVAHSTVRRILGAEGVIRHRGPANAEPVADEQVTQ